MAFGDVVQSNSGTSTTATTTPTLPGATTAGNIIVLQFAADDYNGTPNAGWTQSTGMEQQGYLGSYVWWAVATAAMTIPSYTIGSASRSAWTLVEYAGPFDASPYDTSAGQFANSGTSTYTTPSTTPTSGDRLLIGAMFFHHGSSTNPGTVGSWVSSFAETIEYLTSGTNPSYSIGQATRLVTANGSTAYSTGASVPGATNGIGGLIIAFKAGAGGPATSTGTLTATLGAATAAATGTVLVKGTSAVTLGNVTGTLTGKVTVSGSYVGTLFPAMLSATGTVSSLGATGTLTATLGDATLAGVGVITTPNRTGILNVTLQDATLFAISMPQRYATLDVSLGEATLLARGHVPPHWGIYSPAGDPWVTVGVTPIRVTEVERRTRVIEGVSRKVRILEGRSLGVSWTRVSAPADIWTRV